MSHLGPARPGSQRKMLALALAGLLTLGAAPVVADDGAGLTLETAVRLCNQFLADPDPDMSGFHHFGFDYGLYEDEGDTGLFEVSRGGISGLVGFAEDGREAFCMFDAFMLRLRDAAPPILDMIAAQYGPDIATAEWDGCEGIEYRSETRTVRLIPLNPGNDVFCDPEQGTRILMTAR